MVKEPMESQMSAAHHYFQCAMDFQELMDTQVLIALLHHSQLVEVHTVDFQEETVLWEPVQHHQELHLLCNNKSQPAPIDTPSTANQFALNLKPLDALSLELQPPFQWEPGTGVTDSKVPKPGITPPKTDLSDYFKDEISNSI